MPILVCTTDADGLEAKKCLDSYGFIYAGEVSFDNAIKRYKSYSYLIKTWFDATDSKFKYKVTSNTIDERLKADSTIDTGIVSYFLSICRLLIMKSYSIRINRPFDEFMPNIYDDMLRHYAKAHVIGKPMSYADACKLPVRTGYHLPSMQEFDELIFAMRNLQVDIRKRSTILDDVVRELRGSSQLVNVLDHGPINVMHFWTNTAKLVGDYLVGTDLQYALQVQFDLTNMAVDTCIKTNQHLCSVIFLPD